MRRLVLPIMFLLVSATAASRPANETASTRSWRDGVHYTTLRPEKPIEVVELFSYSCGACNAFEPALLNWLSRKPKDVAFFRVPVTWGRYQEADARLYFTLQVLHREDLHQAIYDTIHRERKILSSPRDEEALVLQTQFVGAHGIRAADFLKARNSPQVNQAMGNVDVLIRRYKAVNTPTIVIDGKYTTTMGQAGGRTELIALIDHLVGLAHREMSLTPYSSAHSVTGALRASDRGQK